MDKIDLLGVEVCFNHRGKAYIADVNKWINEVGYCRTMKVRKLVKLHNMEFQ